MAGLKALLRPPRASLPEGRVLGAALTCGGRWSTPRTLTRNSRTDMLLCMDAAAELRAASPAKINLTLRVGPPRPDGFHPIDSLVTKIDLRDEITVRAAPPGVLRLICDNPAVPSDATNLILRAAVALRDATQSQLGTGASQSFGAAITLRKCIPMGAGLGGGSSNAATTLRLLNELWGLKLSAARLAEIGATLGSDVPLFFYDGVCHIRGRGEIVTPVGRPLRAFVVLILPGLHCATPAVYRAFDDLPPPPSRVAVEQRILTQLDDADVLMPHLFNDLEPAAFVCCPALAELAGRIRAAIPGPLCLSGSGSTMFRLFPSEATALQYAAALRAMPDIRTKVVQTIGVEPRIQ